MQKREHERRDSGIIILLILLLGFICIILASGWALRFAPSWKLDTSMGSNLNPNSDFLTSRPIGFIEPLNSSILTNPIWIDGYLTPGASFATRMPIPTVTNTIQTINTSIPAVTNSPTNIPVATNTLPYFPPPSTATTKPPPPSTPKPPSSTPIPSADLQITKTDNATDYDAGISVQYSIVVSNAGPNGVTGATVTDTFSTNLDPLSITWTCAGSGGASCTASGAGNINDFAVNLPMGTSITYTVNSTVIASPIGSLVNTATVNVPAGIIDPNPSNNTSLPDTDQLVVAGTFPYIDTNGNDIGTALNGSVALIPAGTYVNLQFGTPLVVGSHASYDLVYYLPPSLQVDAVILQISDGKNWYTIFNWGNGFADANTDVTMPLPIPPNPTDCAGEPDQCVIASSQLVNSPGVSINVDGIVPNGSYPYIRIISPPNPPDTGNNGVNVDAIAILP